jgi:hypothetical protein
MATTLKAPGADFRGLIADHYPQLVFEIVNGDLILIVALCLSILLINKHHFINHIS